MTKTGWLILVLGWGVVANAQTFVTDTSTPATAPLLPDVERVRISAERSRLEAGFNLDTAACYQKFLVSNCLDGIKLRHRDALADLRRQEVALNALERKAKGAAQLKRTEEKSSPERQQQDTEQRAAALKDFQTRLDRDKQKNAARAEAQVSAQSNSEALAKRVKEHQEKVTALSSKQGVAAQELKKFNERQEKAKERQARHDRDQLNQAKPAKPLPVPD